MSKPPTKKAKIVNMPKSDREVKIYADLNATINRLRELFETIENSDMKDDVDMMFDHALRDVTDNEGTMVSIPNYEFLETTLDVFGNLAEQIGGVNLTLAEKAEKYDKLMQREDIKKLLDGDGLSVLTP